MAHVRRNQLVSAATCANIAMLERDSVMMRQVDVQMWEGDVATRDSVAVCV